MRPDQLPLQHRTLEVDGRPIAVLLSGEPTDAPPVVAVHGFASSARYTWQSTGHLLALARTGRYVIAPDLLGHGDSAKPHDPASYTLDGMVGVVTGALAAFGGGAAQADLLGYSLGSRIGWEVLQRGGPWRRAVLGGYDGRALFDGVDLDGLVAGMAAVADLAGAPLTGAPLTGAPLTGRPGAADEYAVFGTSGTGVNAFVSGAPEALRDIPPATLRDIPPATLRDIPPATLRDIPPATRRIIEVARAVPGNDQQALLALLTGLAGSGRLRPLPDLPVLMVAGTDDPLAGRAEELAAAAPGARFLAVPGRDHISTVPSRLFRAGVVDFLA